MSSSNSPSVETPLALALTLMAQDGASLIFNCCLLSKDHTPRIDTMSAEDAALATIYLAALRGLAQDGYEALLRDIIRTEWMKDLVFGDLRLPFNDPMSLPMALDTARKTPPTT